VVGRVALLVAALTAAENKMNFFLSRKKKRMETENKERNVKRMTK
jgi:hypothetical protein